MPSPGLTSRAPFTSPDLAFLRHLLGPDEGVKQLVFILVRSRFSLRFFSFHVAFCTLYLVAAALCRNLYDTFMTLAAAGLPFVEGYVGSSPGHYSFSHRRTHVA